MKKRRRKDKDKDLWRKRGLLEMLEGKFKMRKKKDLGLLKEKLLRRWKNLKNKLSKQSKLLKMKIKMQKKDLLSEKSEKLEDPLKKRPEHLENQERVDRPLTPRKVKELHQSHIEEMKTMTKIK